MLLIPLIAIATPLYTQAGVPIGSRVQDLVSRMTLEEKARQLDMYSGTAFIDKKLDNTHTAPDARVKADELAKELGSLGVGSIHDIYPTPAISNQIQKWVVEHNRLHIPALFIEEGVHGYNGFGETLYPCSINLASTFDTQLAQETAAGIGAEARSNGVDMLLGPVLDVAREPRWGRIEEDFGEDPYLTGALGAAYVTGMQGNTLDSDHTVVAEPKHFAGHGSPEGGNNTNPVHAGEREFRTIFLRSFEPAIKAGAQGIMAAYHEVDGVPCAGNSWLLTNVLRKEWGFQGFVLSDLGAIWELYGRHHVAATEADAVRLAISSGVDMQFYDFKHDTFQNALIDGVKSGKMPQAVLDQAVSRVLRVKFELGLFDHPYIDESLHARVSRSQAHLDTALKSARESIVLLSNKENLLPLLKNLRKIAVIGPNAGVARLGDYTPAQSVHGVSMLDGIKAIVPKTTEIVFDEGKDPAQAAAKARDADVVIMGLGERDGISGEGSDRSDLNLPDNQEELLEAVYKENHRVVLVLLNGRPLTIPWAVKNVPAILEAWYPGEVGGQAIAETLFGDNNPSGKLPISFPCSVGALPDFYNHDISKQMRYVDGTAEPLFPFGFGLSYTTFEYSNLTAQPAGPGSINVSVEVANTGPREGDEVIQLYLRPNTSSVETPARALEAFRRVHLKPGAKAVVTFQLGSYELAIWSARKKWEVEGGPYTIWVGGSSDAKLSCEVRVVPSERDG
ncbi:MAG TPA: glycoside hydrolase family 3 N-terminal domain-containing protein [Fimbriimonadaceae bacterium]|nr:glycoside hydrolase family 3 N-terminal domain-containing protein [Fimbriimonadaceae bacterium]